MKHKAWINNYERNFEQLAEEIWDLRYDTLSEFLELLGKKIERDGQKDCSRGRVKLASSLQASAKALADSAENMREAWRICEPYMFPKDITQKVKAEFKAKKTVREAFKHLSDFYRGWDEDIHFRLARCILFETNGDIEKLQQHIQLANTNPQAIMVQAEYDDKGNRKRNFNHPFGEEKINP